MSAFTPANGFQAIDDELLRSAAGARAAQLPPPAPIVKWAGGKGRMVPALIERLPRRFIQYIEPFVGGGALYFALMARALGGGGAGFHDRVPAPAILSDANVDLMEMYTEVRQHPDRVLLHLQRHERLHSDRHYYATRTRWNQGRIEGGAGRAAAFIYLNKACFNGLWRVNRAGELNIPIRRVDAVTLHVRRHGKNMTHGKTLVELNMLRVLKMSLDRQRATTAPPA
jgi:DNA adenine methylase